jgi:hypothetical protein
MHRPDLVPYYEQLYRRGAYAPSDVRRRHGELAQLRRRKARRGTRKAPERERADEGSPQGALF